MSMIDVRDFGATGDGETDDTEAIAAAVLAAESATGVVYLPAGTYRTTAELSANPRRIAIRGDGPQSTFLRPELSAGQYALTLGWDHTIDPSAGIGPFDALTGLSIYGEAGNGIRMHSSVGHAHSMTIRDVSLYGFDRQVSVGDYVYLAHLDRVFFNNAGEFGLYVGDVNGSGENISLTSCVFSGGAGTGLFVDESGASVYAWGCSFDYLARAIWQRAGVVSATSCHFELGTTYGPGGEVVKLDRRGSVNRPMLTLTDCDLYDAWDNYDCFARLSGVNGDNGLRMTNVYVRNQLGGNPRPYLVRDDGGYRSNVVVTGAWYGRGDFPVPKMRRLDGSEVSLTAGVAHVVA